MNTIRTLIIITVFAGGRAPVSAQIVTPAASQQPRAITAQRVVGAPPNIDGRLDEPAWRAASLATGFIQREPNTGAAATEQTEARILYDDDALYVAMHLSDKDAALVAGPLARRDGSSDDSDWAYVMIDANLDRRTAYVFAVNPRGVQKDWLVSDDTREDLTWDAVWFVAARRDSTGWSAEYRIPLSQMRFDPAQTTWGINLARWIARRREYSFWAPWPRSSAGYVSQFGQLTAMDSLSAPRQIEVLPYASTSATREPSREQDQLHVPASVDVTAGLDLKYSVTGNINLTATLNPDFGQVEADPAVVNLTAFETRFSERRPFFIEGTSIFDFEGGEVFYTRRIGRRPQLGIPTPGTAMDIPAASTILGAAKLTGRTSSGWAVGVVNAVTAREIATYTTTAEAIERSPVEPMTNYAVGRIRKDFRSGESSFGAIATSVRRWIDDAYLERLPQQASVIGVDWRHRFNSGRYEVRGHAASSHVGGTAVAIQRLQRSSSRYFERPDAKHLNFDEQATALSGYSLGAQAGKVAGNWRWDVSASARSPGYEINDVGYQQEVDRISPRLRLQYSRFEPGATFRQWDVRFTQSNAWTLGGEPVDASTTIISNFEFRNYWSGFAQILRRDDAFSTSALRGGAALYVPGYFRPTLYLRTDRRKAVTGTLLLNARVGDDSRDRGFETESTVEFRTASLRVSVSPAFEWIAYPWQYVAVQRTGTENSYVFGQIDQKELAIAARVSYVFSPRLTLEVYAQPFVNAGRFDQFIAVGDPHSAEETKRFRSFESGAVQLNGNRYQVDENGDAVTDISFQNPDYTVTSLRSNAVLRWEYRPGSTVYLAWSQARNANGTRGVFDVGDGLHAIRSTTGTHVLLLKVSHWLSF